MQRSDLHFFYQIFDNKKKRTIKMNLFVGKKRFQKLMGQLQRGHAVPLPVQLVFQKLIPSRFGAPVLVTQHSAAIVSLGFSLPLL